MSPGSTGDGPEGRSLPPLHRDRVIEILCDAYAADQITTAELERRLDVANRARTDPELQALLDGIDRAALVPATPGSTAEMPGSRVVATTATGHQIAEWRSGNRRVASTEVPDRQLDIGIWSGRIRQGSWVPARRISAMGLMGGVVLDFREAAFGPGAVVVNAVAVMGGIEIIVPPELRVESNGMAILGGFEDNSTLSSPPTPDAPVLKVKGFALMGGVTVSVRLPGESERQAKRRRKRERLEAR